MTVERSYRVDLRRIEQDVVTELLGSGALVPDGRLQAITEAWNFPSSGVEMGREDVREVWPEFADLLDALSEEDNDDS